MKNGGAIFKIFAERSEAIFKGFPHTGPNTHFSAYTTITTHIGTLTSHIEAITAHTRNATSHTRTTTSRTHPVEHTATAYDKMTKPL